MPGDAAETLLWGRGRAGFYDDADARDVGLIVLLLWLLLMLRGAGIESREAREGGGKGRRIQELTGAVLTFERDGRKCDERGRQERRECRIRKERFFCSRYCRLT